MKKQLLLVWFIVIYSSLSYGQQVDCSNLGFEEGTTRGWILTSGTVAAVNQVVAYQAETVGTVENGHYVTSLSDGNDPKITGDKIPMVAPGSTHSIRIGNTTRGSRFDRIKTTYLVTPDNTLFQYKFAVILENPAHQDYQQPAFSVQITNSTGQTISCSYYNVTSSGSIQGFKNQGDIRYRDWTTGAVDLRNYVGQTITIEVTAHGCTERRHFGYAYFDAQCLKAEITKDMYCADGDQPMTLRAPDGFAAYVWNTGATTQTVQIKPVRGAKYWVKVKPFSSLNETCELQLDHVVDFEAPRAPTVQTASICEGDAYVVGDSSYRRAGTYQTRISRGTGRCDSLVQTTLTVRPLARSVQSLTFCEGESLTVGDTVFRTSGTYVQRLHRNAPLCDSLVATQVILRRFDLAVNRDVLISPTDSVQLIATVQPGGNYQFRWSPAEGLSCPTCAVTWAKPFNTTRYTVSVKNLDEGCQKEVSVTVSVGACTVYAPDAFSPNNDGVNDVFYIIGSACTQRIAELTIYDRWGEIIFRKENFAPSDPASGWNGMYQGILAGSGTYAYTLLVDYIDGMSNRSKGTVMLVR
ncbi:gliding motility-associated C-terminal domain-containing protein [Spirosoma validum]|uniref:Gliding motility-associated C-terminal domain-containing protein n=1 Tax=Spirosoma validum TaxID=2771355 RepID=A0A927GF80_9BACT|nr:gliding motility-associated C-terminal domain-containing protein [Spirosoma validum]MBD2755456.1 gliding motility-associated C-terminal domain-containing protein [Spirosoma validum]